MNSWKAIAATIVIFAAGVLTGGMLSWRLQESSLARRPPHRASPPSSPAGWRIEFLHRAQRELELSPEQRQNVDKILKESQERSRTIMEPVAPQLRAEMQRAKAEFRSLLTPDQQKRFDELLKKQAHPRDQKRFGASSQKEPQTNSLRTNSL